MDLFDEDSMPKFMRHFKVTKTLEWESKYIRLDDLVAMIKLLKRRPRVVTGSAIMNVNSMALATQTGTSDGQEAARIFTETTQLLGVDDTASSVGGDPYESFRSGKQSHTQFFRVVEQDIESIDLFYQQQELSFITRWAECKTYLEIPSHDRNTLKSALVERYRSLLLLRNYAVLNYTAFFEVIKMYNLWTGSTVSPWVYINAHVTGRHFMKSANSMLPKILDEIQMIYASNFTKDNNLELALAELMERRKVRVFPSWANTFKLGMFLGISTPLMFLILVLLTTPATSPAYNEADFYAYLPVFRGIFLVILTVWMWGCLIFVFDRFSVNHRFIMQLNPSNTMTHHQVFKVAAILLAIWCTFTAMFVAHMKRGLDLFGITTQINLYPYILGLLFTAILICPFWVLHRSARGWLLVKLARSVLTPFTPVSFADNFLADFMTSMVRVLYDLEYTACLIVTWNIGYAKCASGYNVLLGQPIINAIPFIWRAAQCYRRYQLSGDKFPHLVNCGKYMASLVSIMIGGIHAFYPDRPWLMGLWIFSLVIATVYAYLWDIMVDWSLVWFQRTGRYSFKMQYKEINQYGLKRGYLFPVITNFFGRCVWSLTIIPNPFTASTSPPSVKVSFAFAVAFVEILRRSQWALFRVENEHTYNAAKFRAVDEVPLSLPTAQDIKHTIPVV